MCHIELQTFLFVLIFTLTLLLFIESVSISSGFYYEMCYKNTLQYIAQYFIPASFLCLFQDRCQCKLNNCSSIVWQKEKHLICCLKALWSYLSLTVQYEIVLCFETSRRFQLEMSQYDSCSNNNMSEQMKSFYNNIFWKMNVI